MKSRVFILNKTNVRFLVVAGILALLLALLFIQNRTLSGTQLSSIAVSQQEATAQVTRNFNLQSASNSATANIAKNTDISSESAFDAAAISISPQNAADVEEAEGDDIAFEFGITDQHLTFSVPIEITYPVGDLTDGTEVTVKVRHEGQDNYGIDGLSASANVTCEAGRASAESNSATVQNGSVTFYTCAASSFIIDPDGNGITNANLWLRPERDLLIEADLAGGGAGTSPENNNPVRTWEDSSNKKNTAYCGVASLATCAQSSLGDSSFTYESHASEQLNYNAVLRNHGSDAKVSGFVGSKSRVINDSDEASGFFFVSKTRDVASNEDNGDVFHLTNNDAEFGVDLDTDDYSYNIGDGGISTINTGANTAKEWSILAGVANGTDYEVFLDGTSVGSSSLSGNNTPEVAAGNYVIGADRGDLSDVIASTPFQTHQSNSNISGDAVQNEITEVIVYNSNVSPDRETIESYLAIKYGISLDQTTPRNYVDSDETVIWDTTTNAGYNTHILALGRDDGFDLKQVATKNSDSDSVLEFDLEKNFAERTDDNDRSVSHANDQQFLAAGSNGNSLDTTTVGVDSGQFDEKTERNWKIQKTANFAQSTFIKFDGFGAAWSLYRDADGDFSSGATLVATLDEDGETPTAITLNDGEYLTLTRSLSAPGGVTTDISAWYRADDGAEESDTTIPEEGDEVTVWRDKAGLANDGTDGGNPTYVENSINFNPAVDFDGTGDYFDIDIAADDLTANSPLSIASVFTTGTVANGNQLVSLHSGTDTNELYYDIRAAGTRIHINDDGTAETVGAGFADNSTYLSTLVLDGINNQVSTDGLAAAIPNDQQAILPSAISRVSIGQEYDTSVSDEFEGQIAEVVIYDTNHTGTDIQRVDSYLAFKYGISLDQTSPIDYLASDSSTEMWDKDAANASNYNSNIFGIGRDDASGLHQRVSTPAGDDAGVTIATDGGLVTSNLDPARTDIAGDLTFITLGDDGTGVTQISTDLVPDHNIRVEREWQVQNNGVTQDVSLGFPMIVGQSNWKLYADDDGDFTNGGTTEVFEFGDLTDGIASNLALAGGEYLSLQKLQTAPGGVTTDLSLWYNGNNYDGTTLFDLVGTGFDLTAVTGQTNDTTAPARTDNGLNFNSTLTFNGTTDGLAVAGLTDFPIDDISFISVQQADENTRAAASSDNAYTYWHYNASTSNDMALFSAPNSATQTEFWFNATNNASTIFDIDDGESTILSFTNDQATSNAYLNGVQVFTNAENNNSVAGGCFGLGFDKNTAACNANQDFLEGSIGEVIVYGQSLDGVDLQKVESYVALKYGISLDQAIDTDYFASDCSDATCSTGTTIWINDADGYEHDIFGIGRDDVQGLDQRVSGSTSPDATVVVALDNDFATSNQDPTRITEHTNDIQFLSIANNDDPFTIQTNEVPAGFNERIGREWKVDASANFTQSVNLEFAGYDDTYTLFVDADGDFSDGNAVNAGALSSDGVASSISLADGDYFTLMSIAPAPGGVLPNLSLWFKADTETLNSSVPVTTGDVDEWTNLAAGSDISSLTSSGVGNSPSLSGVTANFNQTLSFDASNSELLGYDGSVVNTFSDRRHELLMVLASPDTSSPSFFSTARQTNTSGDRLNLRASGATGYQGEFPNATTTVSATNVRDGFNVVRLSVDGNPTNTGSGSLNVNGETVAAINNVGLMNQATNDHYVRVPAINNGTTDVDIANADIAEIVLYDEDISTTQIQQVESYLALKYGLTIDQTVATNYLSSNCTTTACNGTDEVIIWNATDNTGYDSDIFGIGRDDVGDINQVVSSSVNSGSILSVALENDFTSGNVNDGRIVGHNSDLQFLTFGHDGTGTGTVVTDLNTTFYSGRVEREWKVDATNFTQATTLKFDGFDNNWSLITDSDGDFSDGASFVSYLDADGTVDYTPTDGEYLTIAQSILCIWDGEGVDSNWSNPINWVGDAVPSAGCNILFDDTNDKDAAIDAAADVSDLGSLTITDGYDGDIDNSIDNADVTITGEMTADGTGTLTLGSGTWNIGGDVDIADQATIDAAASTIRLNPSAAVDVNIGNTHALNSLVISGSAAATLSASVDVDGSLTVNTGAELNAGSQTITLADNWTNDGTFTASTSTVVLDGDDQTVTGDTTFATLTKNAQTGGSTLTFADGTDITIGTALTLDGDTGDVLTINADSASPTSTPTIDMTGASTFSGDYLNIENSTITDNSSAFTIPVDPANSAEGANAGTTNWFGSLLVEFSAASAASTDETAANNIPTLKLDGTITANQTIDVDITGGSATGGGTDYTMADPVTVTITAGTYDGTTDTVAITGLSIDDDNLIEGDETIEWTLNNPGSTLIQVGDADGNATTRATHTYTITDDDTATIVVDTTGITINENAGSDTFTVVLGAQPTSNVVIDLSSGDTAEGTVWPAALTFTPANWDTAQTVTVTGVNDNTVSNDSVDITVAVNDAGSDDDFDGVGNETVTVTLTDDDTAGVTVTETGGSTDITEGGSTDTYTIVLNTEPAADVVVTIDPDSQSSVGGGADTVVDITFTPANWDTAQTVTVTADDDALAEGAHSSAISHIINTGATADTVYDAVTGISSVTANITDNDSPAVLITESGSSTDTVEGGATDSYEVVLATQPGNGGTVVVMDVTPDAQTDLGSGAGVAIQLTFSETTWNTPQTVTVTAEDDSALEGTHTSTISSAINTTSTTDTDYDAVTGLADVINNITDNDTTTVSISSTSNATENPSIDGEFTLTTSAANTTGSDVTINYTVSGSASSGADYAALSGSVTILDTESSTTIAVPTTGNDDGDTEGNETVVVTLSGTDSALVTVGSPADATVTIADDETDSDGDGIDDASELAICLTYPSLASCPDPGPGDDDDSDGLPDVYEFINGFSPIDPNDPVANGSGDDDGDGVTNAVEAAICAAYPTLPTCPDVSPTDDFDGDGVPDVIEFVNGDDPTDPNSPTLNGDDDDDGDGVSNAVEAAICAAYPTLTSCPDVSSLSDGDGDGLPDVYEFINGFSPIDPNDPVVGGDNDGDNDGLTDAQESVLCAAYPSLTSCPNPGLNDDDDGDGITDWNEFINGFNPTDPNDPVAAGTGDDDGDGITNAEEAAICAAYPSLVSCPDVGPSDDSDNDGIPDITEFRLGSDPTSAGADNDIDGVPDSVELGNINNGDGNGDGIPDHIQDSVTGIVNPATAQYVTLQSVGGCDVIGGLLGLQEASLTAQDPTADYPVGLVDFTLVCANPGDSASVTVFYSQTYDTSSWSFKKYDTNGNVYSDISSIATFGTALVGSDTVTTVDYIVTDGNSQTDQDGQVNGVIDDPAGPAIDVEELSETGQQVVGALIAGLTLITASILVSRVKTKKSEESDIS